MKTWTTIRFVLAAVLVTLAYVGLLLDIRVMAPCLVAVSLLMRPSSSGFWKSAWPWPVKVMFGVFVALVVVAYFVRLREQQGVLWYSLVATMWIVWMLAVFFCWQKEKEKGRPRAEAQRATD